MQAAYYIILLHVSMLIYFFLNHFSSSVAEDAMANRLRPERKLCLRKIPLLNAVCELLLCLTNKTTQNKTDLCPVVLTYLHHDLCSKIFTHSFKSSAASLTSSLYLYVVCKDLDTA